MNRAALTVAGLLAPAFVPARALACAVCFVGSGKTITAFYGTAMLLTALPLLLVGGIALWLRRRLRALMEEERAAAPRNRDTALGLKRGA